MTQNTSLSYRDAGVDIDAGDALVDRIKPLAKKTLRDGVMGGIGLVVFVFGFGLTPGPPRLTSFSRLWPWCARAAPCRLRTVLTACCWLP